MTDTITDPMVASWEARGHRVATPHGAVFVVDVPGPESAADAGSPRPPALVLHGFPSSSFDWQAVVDQLATDRRVVLFDFLGYGLSSKPDQPYTMRMQADIAEAVVAASGLDRVVLVSHDMGDTVGGELLARDLEGTLPFDVVGRLLTNGSIYLDLAQLTQGQQLLASLPDEKLAPGLVTEATYPQSLANTYADPSSADPAELAAQWALASHEDGHLLLPRLIRYLEERRREERRFTGAIESHPSPLAVLWGVEDPIAVVAMVDQLLHARTEAVPSAETGVIRLGGLGHYPMIENPERFATGANRLMRLVDGLG